MHYSVCWRFAAINSNDLKHLVCKLWPIAFSERQLNLRETNLVTYCESGLFEFSEGLTVKRRYENFKSEFSTWFGLKPTV